MRTQAIVHVDAQPGAVERLQLARDYLARHNATCRAFTVAATPMPPYGPGADRMLAAYKRRAGQALAEAAAVADLVAGRLGVEVETLTTEASRVAADCASRFRAYDLIAVATPVEDTAFVDDDVFDAALFLSGRPVLVLPRTHGKAIGAKVAIAWKDCREAARAVHDALPFLQQAESVRLIAVKGEEDPRFFGQAALDRMTAALTAKGVRASAAVIDAGKPGAGPALLAETAGEDVLVMGAYGRWRLSERIFGGMTRHMLAHAKLPLLLSH